MLLVAAPLLCLSFTEALCLVRIELNSLLHVLFESLKSQCAAMLKLLHNLLSTGSP